MARKTVSNSNPGTVDIVGGDDWDNLITDLSLGPFGFSYIINRSGSSYYSQDSKGEIFSSDSTGHPETVIQATIDQCEANGGGNIYISGTGSTNTYVLSGSFAGFTIGNSTGGSTPDVKHVNVICALDAWFKVPAAFAGVFCKFTNATYSCGWYGGHLYQSIPANLWTGFEFESTSQAGNVFHTLDKVFIENAGLGIKLTSNGAQAFVNGNYFHDLVIQECDMGILFNQVDAYSSGNNSMNRNYFNNVAIEHANRAAALYGIKDVIGRGNRFLECKVWDILQTASYHSCTITANAEYTQIDGGIITQVGWPVDNLSSTTTCNDMWTATRLGKGQIYADVSKTGNYTATKADHIIRVDGTSSAFTITLPTAAVGAGREFIIKRTDILASTNLITIDGNSTETINGADKEYLWPGQQVTVESDGTNWTVTSRSPTPSYAHKGTTVDRRAIVAGVLPWSVPVMGNATVAVAADTLLAFPFILQTTTKMDTITFRVGTVGTATAAARVGIYRDNGNTYPGALIFDSGSIAVDSGTGAKNTTITSGLQIFPPGLYWAVYVNGVAAGPLLRVQSGATHLIGIQGVDSGGGSIAGGYGYSVAHTFGALPDPYTGGATMLTTAPAAGSVPIPIISFRVL